MDSQLTPVRKERLLSLRIAAHREGILYKAWNSGLGDRRGGQVSPERLRCLVDDREPRKRLFLPWSLGRLG